MGQTAKIQNQTWSADNPNLAELLNRVTESIMVPTAEPIPDKYIAQAIVNEFGGILVEFDQPDYSKDPEGRVY
jgi:hypothetical protein